jgi:hypothetical protein
MSPLELEISRVVATLDEAVRAVVAAKKYKYAPKPHPPATERQIEEYEHFLRRRLPSSYRAFLRLHNGYDWLVIFGHVLPIEELMPGGKQYDYIREWKLDSAKYGGGEVLDAIVIAELGEPSNYVYLDPNKESGPDDLMVVQADPELSVEYPGLVEFFKATIASCHDIVRRAASAPQSR